ncbi:MAG: DUF1552 domain-containing protein [Planctomycetales bacterium]|nr:DUF1552 domain-containing protein [Planctomycetales bacterium]
MSFASDRRAFLRHLGIGAAAAPFVLNLPSLGLAAEGTRKRRMVVVFSPNGIVPKNFWPDAQGEDFRLKEILAPLEPFKKDTLILRGISDKIRGDGDSHMRGIGCLLTGVELFPGNIQGGSHTPAGWSTGISIDQELKNRLQKDAASRTRFGSLEFGAMVPDRADTWTRMVYAGANKPIAPVDDPYQMFQKLYGQMKDRETLNSVLDDVRDDLAKVSSLASSDDRRLLEEHAELVRGMEQELQNAGRTELDHPVPQLEPGVKEENNNLPRICKMQIDLMVNSFLADFTRIATLQITNSVGQARMTWLGIEEGHHGLSHKPDSDDESQNKLTKINRWYCEQVAYLAQRLAATPEPGGDGSMLDHTTIMWTNELGQGNSHTLDNIPFVLVGQGLGFRMGRSLKFNNVPHNRLLLSLAAGMGHPLDSFGNADYCGDGPLGELV